MTDNVDALRTAYGDVAKRHPFETVAVCVLPEHLHCIWRLPPEDHEYSLRWRLIKSRFSKSPPRAGDARAGRRKGERGIWQRRFWEHAIRDADDLDAHVDYINWNPVKHGLVSAPDLPANAGDPRRARGVVSVKTDIGFGRDVANVVIGDGFREAALSVGGALRLRLNAR